MKKFLQFVVFFSLTVLFSSNSFAKSYSSNKIDFINFSEPSIKPQSKNTVEQDILQNLDYIKYNSIYINKKKRSSLATLILLQAFSTALDNEVYQDSMYRPKYKPSTGEGFTTKMKVFIGAKRYDLVLILREEERRAPVFRRK